MMKYFILFLLTTTNAQQICPFDYCMGILCPRSHPCEYVSCRMERACNCTNCIGNYQNICNTLKNNKYSTNSTKCETNINTTFTNDSNLLFKKFTNMICICFFSIIIHILMKDNSM